MGQPGHPKRIFYPGQLFGKHKYVSEVDLGFFSIKLPNGKSKCVRRHIVECLNCGIQTERGQKHLNDLLKKESECDRCMGEIKGYSGSRALHCIYRESCRVRKSQLLLTLDEFREITSKRCHYCGIEPYAICHNTEWGSYTYNGIDRIDNSIRDYVYENCVPCCYTCNISKSDKSEEDFRRHLVRLINFQMSMFQQQRPDFIY